MPWVHRAEGAGSHTCAQPVRYVPLRKVPDGQPGDVWRCADCGLLWVVAQRDPRNPVAGCMWSVAGWRLRLKHRGAGQPGAVPYRGGQRIPPGAVGPHVRPPATRPPMPDVPPLVPPAREVGQPPSGQAEVTKELYALAEEMERRSRHAPRADVADTWAEAARVLRRRANRRPAGQHPGPPDRTAT